MVGTNKKVLLCLAISVILVVSLVGFASAAGNSDGGFWGWLKGLFGGNHNTPVTGYASSGGGPIYSGLSVHMVSYGYIDYTGSACGATTSNWVGFTSGALNGLCYQISNSGNMCSTCWEPYPCMQLSGGPTPSVGDTFAIHSDQASCLAAAGVCGDGTCSGNENANTCPADCVPVCGNNVTESGGYGGEQCDGGACCNADCTFKSSSTVCRAVAGECDIAESCTGSSGACPSNSFVSYGTSCTITPPNAANICDGNGNCICSSSTEICDGKDNNCNGMVDEGGACCDTNSITVTSGSYSDSNIVCTAGNCIVQKDLNFCSGAGLTIGTNSITLDCNGHKLVGPESGNGITLSGRTGVTVKNCDISRFTTGIYLANSYGNTIRGNKISSSTYGNYVIVYGINVWYSSSNLIESNIINARGNGDLSRSYNHAGIFVEYTSPSNVIRYNNISVFNGTDIAGIMLNRANTANSTIIDSNNLFVQGGNGGVGNVGVYVRSSNTTIINNSITSTSYTTNYQSTNFGIEVDGWSSSLTNNRIISNRINVTQSGAGVYTYIAKDVLITSNSFWNTGTYGLYLDLRVTGAPNITVYHNNFYDNGASATVYFIGSTAIDLTYNGDGNFWGRTTMPCFISGTDSSSTSVTDSHCFIKADGWVAPAQVCGNGIKEGTEVCDNSSQVCTVGGYAGTQTCNASCTGWNACTTTQYCGDGLINDAEQCDGGTQACTVGGLPGTQTCSASCTWNACAATCTDPDNDGIKNEGGACGAVDNCPTKSNHDQLNSDSDAQGDVCDSCPEDTQNNCDQQGQDSDEVCAGGGSLQTGNGKANVTIPAGALDLCKTITLVQGMSNFRISMNRGQGRVWTDFDILPLGATFNTPVTIQFRYDQGSMQECGQQERGTEVYYNDPVNGWQVVSGSVLNCSTNTVTAQVTHFSNYAAITFEDADGDGYPANWDGVVDCNDNDPTINPGAAEICGNAVDEDCDGTLDNGCGGTCDTDGDGYMQSNLPWCAIFGPITDCDDDNPNVNPGATEVCNGIDDNCAGGIDEGFTWIQAKDQNGNLTSVPSGQHIYVSYYSDACSNPPLGEFTAANNYRVCIPTSTSNVAIRSCGASCTSGGSYSCLGKVIGVNAGVINNTAKFITTTVDLEDQNGDIISAHQFYNNAFAFISRPDGVLGADSAVFGSTRDPITEGGLKSGSMFMVPEGVAYNFRGIVDTTVDAWNSMTGSKIAMPAASSANSVVNYVFRNVLLSSMLDQNGQIPTGDSKFNDLSLIVWDNYMGVADRATWSVKQGESYLVPSGMTYSVSERTTPPGGYSTFWDGTKYTVASAGQTTQSATFRKVTVTNLDASCNPSSLTSQVGTNNNFGRSYILSNGSYFYASAGSTIIYRLSGAPTMGPLNVASDMVNLIVSPVDSNGNKMPDCAEQQCGNAKVEGTEVCDGNSRACVIGGYNGNQNCNAQCTGWNACVATEFCGDGLINDAEQCDDGSASTPITCGVGACQVTVADSCVSCANIACVPLAPTGEVCNGADDDCDGSIDEDFVCDATAPSITATSVTPLLIGSAASMTISKTVTDAESGVASVTASVIGPSPSTNVVGTVSLSLSSGTAQNGVWTGAFVFPDMAGAPDGTYTVSDVATDARSNSATVTDGSIVLDRTAPSLSIISIIPSTALTGSIVVVTVSASDATTGISSISAVDSTTNIAAVLASGNTLPTPAGLLGTWVFNQLTALPTGTHTETVSVSDLVNNIRTATGTFIVTNCGNGVVDAGEQCDDANGVDKDCCKNDCTIPTKACGNGCIETGEQCDDGNTGQWDGCFNCNIYQANPNYGWRCDPFGPRDIGKGPSVCTSLAGNGVVDDATTCLGPTIDGCKLGVEQCDDGNSILWDGCQLDGVGKMYIYAGFRCSPFFNSATGRATGYTKSICTPLCGDCIIDSLTSGSCLGATVDGCVVGTAEQCEEDKNTNQWDGCNKCAITNPTVWAPRDTNNDKLADLECAYMQVCGNGVREGTEQCDDGSAQTPTTCGTGACVAGIVDSCVNCQIISCVPGTPTSETCNSVDDDCDGTVDESLTRPTTCGRGICSGNTGIETCTEGVWGGDTCNPFGGAGVESCNPDVNNNNGVDENCDGSDLDCSFSCDRDNDGYRDASRVYCLGNDCNDNNANINPGASDTNCNGVDEDCSGVADNGYVSTPTTCGSGVCAAGGQLICVNGATQDTCAPGQPTGADDDCNGIDEDCSGTNDNNYAPRNTECGVGACASSGVTSCVNGAEYNSCTPGTPGTEYCDAGLVDEDCDGAENEDCDCIVGTTMQCGPETDEGECVFGTQTCDATGHWGDCEGAVLPSPEVCNGLDDDCDGTVDNGFDEGVIAAIFPLDLVDKLDKKIDDWGVEKKKIYFNNAESVSNRMLYNGLLSPELVKFKYDMKKIEFASMDDLSSYMDTLMNSCYPGYTKTTSSSGSKDYYKVDKTKVGELKSPTDPTNTAEKDIDYEGTLSTTAATYLSQLDSLLDGYQYDARARLDITRDPTGVKSIKQSWSEGFNPTQLAKWNQLATKVYGDIASGTRVTISVSYEAKSPYWKAKVDVNDCVTQGSALVEGNTVQLSADAISAVFPLSLMKKLEKKIDKWGYEKKKVEFLNAGDVANVLSSSFGGGIDVTKLKFTDKYNDYKKGSREDTDDKDNYYKLDFESLTDPTAFVEAHLTTCFPGYVKTTRTSGVDYYEGSASGSKKIGKIRKPATSAIVKEVVVEGVILSTSQGYLNTIAGLLTGTSAVKMTLEVKRDSAGNVFIYKEDVKGASTKMLSSWTLLKAQIIKDLKLETTEQKVAIEVNYEPPKKRWNVKLNANQCMVDALSLEEGSQNICILG